MRRSRIFTWRCVFLQFVAGLSFVLFFSLCFENVQIIRGGRRVQVSIFDIVVGDVIPLKIGDQVNAFFFSLFFFLFLLLIICILGLASTLTELMESCPGPCWWSRNLWPLPCSWWIKYDWREQDCKFSFMFCIHYYIFSERKSSSMHLKLQNYPSSLRNKNNAETRIWTHDLQHEEHNLLPLDWMQSHGLNVF